MNHVKNKFGHCTPSGHFQKLQEKCEESLSGNWATVNYRAASPVTQLPRISLPISCTVQQTTDSAGKTRVSYAAGSSPPAHSSNVLRSSNQVVQESKTSSELHEESGDLHTSPPVELCIPKRVRRYCW